MTDRQPTLFVGSHRQRAERVSSLDLAVASLRSGDFQSRWDLSKTLTGFGVEAIAPLLDLLEEEDTDWELLWFITRILSDLQHPDTITTLLHLLKTTDSAEVRNTAAIALANLGTVAIAPLTELLAAEPTRLTAVQALAQIPHADVIDSLLQVAEDTSSTVRAAAIDALSRFSDPKILPVLIHAAQDTSTAVRRAAVMGLGLRATAQNNPELVQVLKPLLWDLNLEVCQQAALALSRVGTDDAAVALFEVLRSPYTPVGLQVEVVRALGWIATPQALQHLQAYLMQGAMQPTPTLLQVSQEIIQVLGQVEKPETRFAVAQIFIDLLENQHPAMEPVMNRRLIALTLGHLGQPCAIDALIALLADADMSVRLHAIAALKQLDAKTAYQRLTALSQVAVAEPLRQGVAIALQEWSL